MKSRLISLAIITAALTVVTWPTITLFAESAHGARKDDQSRVASTEPSAKASTANKSPSAADPDIAGTAAVTNPPELEEMRRQQALIWERLHITAPMEAEDRNGVDPVEQSTREGLILPATIEQVEAALAAAAATPDEDDDQRALDLKQRGSYRFYFVASAPESPASKNQ